MVEAMVRTNHSEQEITRAVETSLNAERAAARRGRPSND
jgi:hypothetical protein